MGKKEIESFLLHKKGYLKKSPLNVAKAIWKSSKKHTLPKTATEIKKELDQVREVLSSLKLALAIQQSSADEQIIEAYSKIIAEKDRPKRKLLFDIEVSPNLVFSWRTGSEVDISPDSIVQERAIICVCYKWLGDSKVHAIKWNRGDDKDLLLKFSKVINSADEVITQNGDNFDIKWLRTRCIHHNILIPPKFNSIDTLKMARTGFKFNSNKLDYMGKFLGLGQKVKTEYSLWTDIVLYHSRDAMNKMITYCKQDVNLLEQVYNKLQAFCPAKKFKYRV